MVMTLVSLRADCAQCAALCCVALAFDRSSLFAIDKAAGEPCPNLSACDRCTIHAHRAARGFAECAQFDCMGAGQRVTRLFAGRSWRDGEAQARAIFDAFSAMRRVHALIGLLRSAAELPLDQDVAAECRRLCRLVGASGWSEGDLADFACSGLEREVLAFIRGLRRCVGGRTQA